MPVYFFHSETSFCIIMLGNRVFDYFPYPCQFFYSMKAFCLRMRQMNCTWIYKKTSHKLIKTKWNFSYSSYYTLQIQKKSPPSFLKLNNNCCTWVGINSVLKFTFRDSDYITCRWVKITKFPTKNIEELLFSNKSSADTTFHFRNGPSIKALTFVADGSTSLWRWRAELKWLFWGVPSWQWMKKGEEEQRKGGNGSWRGWNGGCWRSERESV